MSPPVFLLLSLDFSSRARIGGGKPARSFSLDPPPEALVPDETTLLLHGPCRLPETVVLYGAPVLTPECGICLDFLERNSEGPTRIAMNFMQSPPLLRRLGPLFLSLLFLVGSASSAHAQVPTPGLQASPWDPMIAFLRPYGVGNFSPFYKRTLKAWLNSSAQYRALDYIGTQQTLDALWLQQPISAAGYGNQATQPFGINIGSPPCYTGLRMLTDTVDWRVSSGVQGSQGTRSVVMTVLIPGKTHGIEPRTLAELTQGTGVPVVHALDERVLANDFRVVQQSLELFREYVLAMTQGALSVDVQILYMPDVDMEVQASESQNRYYAGLTNYADIWAQLPESVLEGTDWWWMLYPSHVPEQYPDFQNAEFVTGGMGTGEDSQSPFFLIDDRWLIRKPPHIGTGLYSDVERRAYLPQWLQHEFFHHLFRTYPEFQLEATSHQWFNLSTWPADFDGRYEADYFHEALYKRLQSADPALHVALRYATADAPWENVQLTDVMGAFRREPVLNNWHIGTIEPAGSGLRWVNNAGVSWLLTPDLLNGELLTGPDCPYYNNPSGKKFNIVLKRDAFGDFTDEVIGFSFSGEFYELQ